VTLKIEKTLDERGAIIKLMGRIRGEELAHLKSEIPAGLPRVTLDLKEVSLVDGEAVRFLSTCESEGVQLLNCSAYIREWIIRDKQSSIKR
jgi:hypothetical protein